ncbi:MAG: hybrid nucleoside-diphosphate sugar epimerase/sugar transferase [Hyphomicrobiales bacterium]|uniref:hybrid nucleoside-diphosphate sugar epimerase/sugar transferase n=1 Tax=Roseibium polysiphoniae TaxID=2571221 RepID=UPI003299B770
MKLLITGATGNLGQKLVEALSRSTEVLVLLDQDSTEKEFLFPGVVCSLYRDLPNVLEGVDVVLHLALLNKATDVSEDAVVAANTELTRTIAEAAPPPSVPTFINVSSLFALEDASDMPYARSKQASVQVLNQIDGIRVLNLYLPASTADHNANNPLVPKKLPKTLYRLARPIFSALEPTLQIEKITEFLETDLNSHPDGETVFLANSSEEKLVYRLSKKLIDYGFATSVVLLFWWLLTIVWILVKFGSEGPGIFAQERVGENGKIFTCYKFRSMGKDTRQAGTHEVSESAVTPIGSFIRKTKIDELPQVWNILKGELSLVGPRPCLPVQEKLVAERNKRGVLDVLPGITGLAQIQGIDMSDPVRLARKDAEYIARRGLILDLKIILATFTGKGQGDRTAK